MLFVLCIKSELWYRDRKRAFRPPLIFIVKMSDSLMYIRITHLVPYNPTSSKASCRFHPPPSPLPRFPYPTLPSQINLSVCGPNYLPDLYSDRCKRGFRVPTRHRITRGPEAKIFELAARGYFAYYSGISNSFRACIKGRGGKK
jgi:hypothetical protein